MSNTLIGLLIGWLGGAVIWDPILVKGGWYVEEVLWSYPKRLAVALLWPCVIAAFAFKGLIIVLGEFLYLILYSFTNGD